MMNSHKVAWLILHNQRKPLLIFQLIAQITSLFLLLAKQWKLLGKTNLRRGSPKASGCSSEGVPGKLIGESPKICANLQR